MPTAMREALENGSTELISLVAQACNEATKVAILKKLAHYSRALHPLFPYTIPIIPMLKSKKDKTIHLCKTAFLCHATIQQQRSILYQ